MNTDVKEKNSSLIQFLNDNNIFEFKRQKILGDASHRLYERIIYSDDKGNDKSYILMLDKDLEQINRFKYIGEFLYNINISVPKIYATDEQNGLLLIEDLKVDSFSLILAGASILSKNNAVNRKLYRYAIAAISKMQRAKISIKLEDFSKDKYKEELEIFLNWYSRHKSIYLTNDQKDSFWNIWEELFIQFQLENNVLVHKDFHADNLLWLPKRELIQKVGIIDFQDALIGSPIYDVVSLLQDARVDIDPNVEKYILNQYFDMNPHIDKNDFLFDYAILGAQRNLKILGVFARLSIKFSKDRYLDYIPRVWGYIIGNLKHPVLSDLQSWLLEVMPDDMKEYK